MRLESPTRIRARPPISPSARVQATSPSALRLQREAGAYFASRQQPHIQHEQAFPSSAGPVALDRAREQGESEACQLTCSFRNEASRPQSFFPSARTLSRRHKLRRKTRRLIDLLQDDRTALQAGENGLLDTFSPPAPLLRPCPRRSQSFGGDLCSVSVGGEAQSTGDVGSGCPSSPAPVDPDATGTVVSFRQNASFQQSASCHQSVNCHQSISCCRSLDVIDLISCSQSGQGNAECLVSSPTICCGGNDGNVETSTGNDNGRSEPGNPPYDDNVSQDCSSDAAEGTGTQACEDACLAPETECAVPPAAVIPEADQHCAECVAKTTNNCSKNHLCFAHDSAESESPLEAKSRKRPFEEEEGPESSRAKKPRNGVEDLPSRSLSGLMSPPPEGEEEEEEGRECVLACSIGNCNPRVDAADLYCCTGETTGDTCEEEEVYEKGCAGEEMGSSVQNSLMRSFSPRVETIELESWCDGIGEPCLQEENGVDGGESTTSTQALSKANFGGMMIENMMQVEGCSDRNCSGRKSGAICEEVDGVYSDEFRALVPKGGLNGNGEGDMVLDIWDEQQATFSDPLEHLTCVECRRGDGEDEMLICDKCERGYHMYCLCPILVAVPPGNWFCPKCEKKPEVKEFPMVQTKIVDFFRISRPLFEHSRSSLKRPRRHSRYVFSYRRRRCLLPHRPSTDPARRLEQMASLATALTASGVEFSDRLTYVPGLAPRSCNRAQLEIGGMQVMPKTSRAAYALCKEMTKRGECAPLLVRHDSKQGFVVEAADAIPDLTIIAEYTGDVDFVRNRENDPGDCIMGLLTPRDPDMELVICPDKRGNVSRFLSGINNYDRAARKKINVRCVRFAVDGEAIALLVSVKDIRKGDFLYYDYNGLSRDGYPTHHFV
ncbi:hypothetical protein CBR_g10858 [Chara braunii]|uniref:PHD-type domain-containing protein n=1 Tax=Chara braunii TaxID=69332 RepID=A0A388KPF0_CHABU|nr:hypothetical protein CBR_g10858 [Chara braunii]|eukprot:GBG71922.1 hypothetical protein CBR_g10858 [Chara braunii]